MPTMHIRLLGDLSITYGEMPVTVNSARLQSLLAFLLLHSQTPQSRQQIAFSFWSDLGEKQARNNLRQLIFYLRRVLPDADSFIEIGDTTVRWRSDAPFTLDVLDFENALALAETAAQKQDSCARRGHLEQAIGLYRGDLLLGCYDDWIVPERERLRQRFMRAIEGLVVLLEEQRDYRVALGHAQRLLHCDPLREETYRDLMRLASRCGDGTGVIRYYRACVNTLRKELEVEPTAETQQVYAESLNSATAGQTEASPLLTTEGHLPLQPNRFIGRLRELEEVKRRMSESRLVTLTGPAGVGKTRLALAIAAEAEFVHGSWFVSLGPVADPSRVVQAVASTLGIREVSGRPLLETVSESLRDKHLLLVLDNCEHLTTGVRQLSHELLSNLPGLSVLATSREILGLASEAIYRVPPMAVPQAAEEIPHSDSVELFCERAQSILPSFELSAENSPLVVSICQQLNGLPLAIELAAARMNVLSADQISQRLGAALQLLTRGHLAALPHQRTVQATLDWSYGLLSTAECGLLRRLAVFSGSFGLDAVESICAVRDELDVEGSIPVLDLLANLIDKSLVEVIPGDRVVRYHLLEVVRQYAWERLCDSGEQPAIRRAHSDFYLQWAERAEAGARGARQLDWFTQFEQEHENLRSAFEWCQLDSPEKGLRLGAALWWLWFAGGYLSEGRSVLAKSLAASGLINSTAYVRALNAAAFLALFQGDFGAARQQAQAAQSIAKELNDKRELAMALFILGDDVIAGAPERVIALRKASLALSEEIGDKWMMAFTLNALGELERLNDDYTSARSLYEASLALRREIEDRRGIAVCFTNLGFVASHAGNIAEAHDFLRQALALRWELKDKVGVATTLLGMAGIQLKDASPEALRRAAVWLGALAAGLERIWTPLIGPDRKEFEEVVAAARERLGEIEMERALAEGQRMPLERAIAEALGNRPPDKPC